MIMCCSQTLKDRNCGWRRDEVQRVDAKRWLKQLCQVLFYVEPFKKRFEDRGHELPEHPLGSERVYNNPRAHGHCTQPSKLDAKRLLGYSKNLISLCQDGGFLEKRSAWNGLLTQ